MTDGAGKGHRGGSAPSAKSRPCPICKAPSTDAFRPFCSRRCADIDLGRWFSGSYAIAGSEDTADGEAAPQGLANDGNER